MTFDTKVAVLIRDDLLVWQKLNVACFVAGGLVAQFPILAGEPYVDASGRQYGPMIRQPVLVFSADAAQLTKALQRAEQRGLRAVIYTEGLFATGNDVDNRAVVASLATEALDLVGIAVHGPKKDVDKVTDGLKLHR
ncbi:MAG TPA: DUF2000 domain-containing protein [Thermoanaerobaculia bacterium]|nr:DUF2000 domain-containing protein [Thermoanaerobaculia bacterium]